MKLLSRGSEIELLRRQRWLSEEQFSRMTLVTGRRLSGKTALISEAYSDRPFLYFKLGGKSEKLQLEEYVAQVKDKLDLYVSRTVLNFRLLMDFLFKSSELHPMTVVLENFDELMTMSPDYYEVLKTFWKSHVRRHSHLNLVLTITNPARLAPIFDNEDAPLLNCLDMKIPLGFLSLAQIRDAMDKSGKTWTPKDLLTLYMITGGCPKYITYAIENGAVSSEELLRLFIRQESPYLWDVRRMISEALGHNSEVYVSILQLIAQGVVSMGELQERLGGIIIGGHLAKLENDYCLVTKTRPVLAGAQSRNVVRYEISDQFTDFWLRYIEPARESVELGDMDRIYSAINEDSKVYSKIVLKRYFTRKFVEEYEFREIGGDWKAGKDAVEGLDIIGIDRKNCHALVADVELGAEDFEKGPFLERVNALKNGPLKGYSVDSRLFTLNDI